MSTTPSVRPAFSSEVEEEVLSKPISKMAIVSAVLGLVSLLAPLTSILLPVAIVAAILGLIGSVSLASKNSTQSGSWFANVGLFLGLTCAIWSVVSAKLHRDKVAQQAAEFSIHYLQLIAQNDLYQAAELHLGHPGRQMAGLDLKDYYESYQGSITDETLQGGTGSPSPKALAKRRLFDLRESALTKYLQSNATAKWKFDSLQSNIYMRSSLRRISAILSNSEKPSDKVEVVLERQEYLDGDKLFADWYVKSARLMQ